MVSTGKPRFEVNSIDQRIVIFTGNYGSGKTEVAINYTRHLAHRGERTTIVDLDIVNPYFRCREAKEILKREGIETISPEGNYAYADLPIILPQIKGELKGGTGRLVLDVGGDDAGARILSSFADAFRKDDFCLLVVLNSSRPFMDTVDGCLKMIGEIETASRLTVNGIVDNSHLIEETELEVVERGYELAEKVSRKTSIPLKFIAIEKTVLERIETGWIECDILPIERLMTPPWKRDEGTLLGKDIFKL
jgi:hypothetical protein